MSGMGIQGGDKVKSLDNSIHLPIFRLFGGSVQNRQQLFQTLKAILAARFLSCTCVPLIDQENGALGGFESSTLQDQARSHDVVFLDCGEDDEKAKGQILLSHYNDHSIIPGAILAGTSNWDIEKQADWLLEKIEECAALTPVWGCILIGGKSSRMGQPKHLIKDKKDKSWLERSVELLSPLVDGLVVSGAGTLPDKLSGLHRLEDLPGVVGPLTGILAASRWQPMVSWLFVACDMPFISLEAARWLLSSHRAGCWGRVPRLSDCKYPEPLFAWYDFRAGHIFEQQLSEGNLRIGAAAKHPKIDNPLIPENLSLAWKNINTPEQLKAARGK